MLALQNIADFRMQQQIAHEMYRQQIMQRLPDPFAALHFPFPQQQHFVPTHPSLPGKVEAKLENNELWQQFHKIGTEMIITKCGRRMFPSMRVSLSGLEAESNYCVLLEMVPIGDCRYKFSGSQWVPAGGAEPQSPQRMYLHPDSPATGAHWQSQALLFNKVKLTNNTLDNNGQIVLASMHKYQPRLHIICTSDLSQIPWAPQQAYVFPETEFIAVTAYQNDRITKLKIDNNPFAKGFRESGQSRCKRKLPAISPCIDSMSSSVDSGSEDPHDESFTTSSSSSPQAKRMRASPATLSDEHAFGYESALMSSKDSHYMSTMEANLRSAAYTVAVMPQFYAAPLSLSNLETSSSSSSQHLQQIDYARRIAVATTAINATAATTAYPNWLHTSLPSSSSSSSLASIVDDCDSQTSATDTLDDDFVDVVSTNHSNGTLQYATTTTTTATSIASVAVTPKRSSSFSISDILGKSDNGNVSLSI